MAPGLIWPIVVLGQGLSGCLLLPCLCYLPADYRREVSCSEAVVDIDGDDTAGAGIEHGEEGCEAAEACAVADAGRHCDDGLGDESADDAGERALHAGDDNDDAGILQLLLMVQKAVDSGNADIVDAIGPATCRFDDKRGFLGHGKVRGACGDDGTGADFFIMLTLAQLDDACIFVILGFRQVAVDGFKLPATGACAENYVCAALQGIEDTDDLVGSLILTIDDLGKAGSQIAVMVDFGVSQVLEGQVPEALQRPIDGEASIGDFIEQLSQFVFIHVIGGGL